MLKAVPEHRKAALGTGIVILAVQFVAYADPPDPGGWQQAKWGMTEAQVLEIYPTAKKSEPDSRAPGHLLMLDSVTSFSPEGQGGQFGVEFWFGNSGLQLVALTPIGEQIHTPKVYYELMLNLLTDRYGLPSSKEEKTKEGTPMKEATWLLKTTEMKIVYLDSPSIPQNRTLVIQYRKLRDRVVPKDRHSNDYDRAVY